MPQEQQFSSTPPCKSLVVPVASAAAKQPKPGHRKAVMEYVQQSSLPHNIPEATAPFACLPWPPCHARVRRGE